jgi:hypothetical protein
MRKINENDYVDFTIVAPGWSLTVSTFKKALGEWANIRLSGCTLYGNKPNGTRAIIDSK